MTASHAPIITLDTDHIYRVDGVVRPSVTQILERAGLVDYNFLPPSVRTMALERGAAVHLATQLYDEHDLDWDSIPGLVPYVEAWGAAVQHYEFEFTAIEQRGYNDRYGFCGTLDRLARNHSGDWIIDIKCGEAPWWVRLQLAAYASFLPEPRRYKRVCIELKPTGQWRAFEFRAADYTADFNDFLCAQRVAEMKETNR